MSTQKKLRFFIVESQLLPTSAEVADDERQQKKLAQAQVEAEREQKELAQQRAEILAAQVRELGIEPNIV